MTAKTKGILKRSLEAFLSSNAGEKYKCVQAVQNNLHGHYKALNSIGLGYCKDTVQAGEIFLRIYKNIKL